MDDPARAPATSSDPIDRAELAALAVITALGVLCRLAALRQPMRYDEASAWADFIGRDWWTILSRYPTPNNHVFFSLIAKLTSALAPYRPWAIRLPALLPGIAIVPATWAVGRRLADRATALLGAALAAGSMPLVLYSANARGHSLELDVLSETGVVGLALLLAAIGVPLVLAFLRAPSSPLGAGLAAAAVFGFAHASVDWVWTFPAFGVLLWALVGIALAGNGEQRGVIRGWPALACGIASLALAVGAFALPWISSRLTSHALSHPAGAADDLRWAKRLDPLAVEPWLAQSSLSLSAAGSIQALEHAVDMQPRASGLRYLLGQAYLRAGAFANAERTLARAHQLDPHDSDIVRALRRARAGP